MTYGVSLKPQRDIQQAVQEVLRNLKGLEPLKGLFWSELNYERVNRPMSTRGWSDMASKALAEDPVLFASGGKDGDFHIIYTRLVSERLLLTEERPLVTKLLKDHPYALFIFSNSSQDRWHFLNVKYDEKGEKRRLFRRITVAPEERLRTAAERISLLQLTGSESPPLTIQQAHDGAFDVEAVTKQFYKEYKRVFADLEDSLVRQTRDRPWSHDYALQLINRIMFLYFVQRKRWLADDTEFLRSFWAAYHQSGQPQDTFFSQWLRVLFFEAFNNKFHGGHRQFQKPIQQALALAPYLNGGLFRESDLDQKHAFTVSDELFTQLFGFLEHYNFTISEDSPIDQEVAVDPEMIGKVYESLVNVEETAPDKRSAAGIFYTPRTEIDLMCRLALVDHLANHLGQKHKGLLYEAVFALEPDEKDPADEALAKTGLWPELDRKLQEIAVLDPACGSGSFLVGLLHVLDDLQARSAKHLKKKLESVYKRKKRIIGQNLYGVDVMDWACHVAELRLWLALIVDAEFTREELHVRTEPLLPHFTFKIRCGDSLVQEVGGIDLGHVRESRHIPPPVKSRITKLKAEKLKFYNNDPTCQFRSDKEARQEELRLFRDILEARHRAVEEEIKSLRRKIAAPKERQMLLDGTVESSERQSELFTADWKRQIESLAGEMDRIDHAAEALRPGQPAPFVWDIAFVEIFESEKEGFDIVIGNPPYVRQESIADPRLPPEKVNPENKRAYKAKLARSVYAKFPEFFGQNPEAPRHKLDAKSDLYISFYFHGLSLLNSKGSFCFITSNSWLDVGYGADLQEFLLKHCHVKLVLDNQVKRSFAQADVNTVIALFSSPDDDREWGLDQTARFVMFQVPFEHLFSPPGIVFEEIEAAAERRVTPEYRVYPVSQKKLLEDGCDVLGEEDDEDVTSMKRKGASGPLIKVARYLGNKWGGKYLRAPDIYWTILEKGKGKLVRLGDVADVRRGFTTGVNEFFYLEPTGKRTPKGLVHVRNSTGWEGTIEREFLRPVIKSPRDYYCIGIDRSDTLLFWCRVELATLRGSGALAYIRWGETQGFPKAPSCQGRKRWYSLNGPESPKLLWPSAFFERHIVYECPAGYVADKVFYAISGKIAPSVKAYLNSSITSLFIEVEGYQLNHGGIFVTTEWLANLPVIVREDDRLMHLYEKIASREISLCADELNMDDRRALDLRILELLGVGDKATLKYLHQSIQNYVANRIHKARRSTTKRGRIRYLSVAAT